MKLLNELISLRRLDDETEQDQTDQHDDQRGAEEFGAGAELDPGVDDTEGLDDVSDDMGGLDDKQGGDDYQDVSPDNPYDEGTPEHEAWVAGYEAATQDGGDDQDADVEDVAGDEQDLEIEVGDDEVPTDDIGDEQPVDELPVEDEEQPGLKEECPSCNGTGVDYGETCVRCGGKGHLVSGQYDDHDDEPQDMTDVEADADTLANIGWGTDEDYGKYEDEGASVSTFAKYYHGRARRKAEDEEDVDFYTDKNWRDRYGKHEEPKEENATDRGYAACQAGKGREANPYPRSTEEYNDWDQAWNDGNESMQGSQDEARHQHDYQYGQHADQEDCEVGTMMPRAYSDEEDGGEFTAERIQGYRAFEGGKDNNSNPHPKGSPRNTQWFIGWVDAKRDLAKARKQPVKGFGDENEEQNEWGGGAYDQQGAHMGGAKDTTAGEQQPNPEAGDDVDLNAALGDNEGGDETDPKLDAITDKASEDPDRQGLVRKVKGAHLVYKRQIEDGTYEELWIYNSGNMRDELDIRKAVLAGTDIPTTKTSSPDGTQKYELWSAGNAEMLQIQGLPN